MRIAYCTNVRLPSERAHGHQIAQVCDALARIGQTVSIFAPFRKNIVTREFNEYYNVHSNVDLHILGTFDPIASPALPGVAGLWTLNGILRRNLHRELLHGDFDLLYTRSPALLAPMLMTGIPTILELHRLPRRAKAKFVKQCASCALVVCLTNAMRDELITWGVHPDKIIVEGDAVDLPRFAQSPSRQDAHQALNLHTDRIVIGYAGRLKTLGMEKGVADLLKALSMLRDTGKYFGLIVGGPESDKNAYESMARSLHLGAEDILFTGEVDAAMVPTALAACDILAMPFPDKPHYRTNMSPLKMFEYMAAQKPIIASDLPTIRDALSEETAFFCEPGDPESLARTLEFASSHQGDMRQRAGKARELVEWYTWEKRMQRILSEVESGKR